MSRVRTPVARAEPYEETMRWFLRLAGGTLALTGLATAFSAIGQARALDAADPIVGIPFRQLLLLVGLVVPSVSPYC